MTCVYEPWRHIPDDDCYVCDLLYRDSTIAGQMLTNVATINTRGQQVHISRCITTALTLIAKPFEDLRISARVSVNVYSRWDGNGTTRTIVVD